MAGWLQLLLSLLVAPAALGFSFGDPVASSWTCTTVSEKPASATKSVIWRNENCTAEGLPNFVVNSLHIDLTASDIRITPGVSKDASAPLTSIDKIAASYTDKKLIAGVNGGYFWRTDITGFWVDDVCRGKWRSDAEKPPSAEHVNYGIHDGTVLIDKQALGYNCDCWGYSRPVEVQTTGGNSAWSLRTKTRGQQVDGDVTDALAGGPNLVSYTAEKGAFIDIPEGEDNINRFEHAAQTAVGINFDEAGKSTQMTMVTVDGEGDKHGMGEKNLASLMLHHFKAQQATSFDQGGSTTMFVSGESNNGIVSNAGGGARAVANGLFVQLVA